MLTEKTFDTGELILSYDESESAGSPLVLLHGLTSNRGAWSLIIPVLEADWHVYAPDLRGHGKSGRAPDNAYANQDYARDVIAFLKQLREPAVLIGHSLGAMTGIVTASRYPAGVRALVLLDPPLHTYNGSVHLYPGAANWFMLIAAVKEGNPAFDTMVARIRDRMPNASDEEVIGTANYIIPIARGTVETALREEIWQGVDLPRALQQINCPTMMLHGDWDVGGAMREEDVALFKANCPSAQVVRIPGADHGLKVQEQPDVVLQPITTFLSGV
jgi:pimeloyl-ACP methyl ester carboxylesterase